MTRPFDLLVGGQFEEAIAAYKRDLSINPEKRGARDGLASALMGAGQYEAAIPLKWAAHEDDVRETPDTCGKLFDLACAYWCIDDRQRAIELAHGLVEGNLARRINMAPDLAGGASFGLVLYYMAVTVHRDDEREYALAFLQKLKAKYDKTPTFFADPKVTVQQLFGSATFEDAVEAASKERSVVPALAKASILRAVAVKLSVVLFFDGIFRRAAGDEAGFRERMNDVCKLAHWADPIYWYFARNEVGRLALEAR
jgi:tetratricopeptide (TPR) repeat protein